MKVKGLFLSMAFLITLGVAAQNQIDSTNVHDSLRVIGDAQVNGFLITKHIKSPDGTIHFGDSSMTMTTYTAVSNPIKGGSYVMEGQSTSGSTSSIGIGWSSYAAAASRAMAFGLNTKAYGDNSMAFGNLAEADADWSTAFGYNTKVSSSATYAIALGSGYASNPMVNGTSQSLAVGFNSTVPTLFVTGGNGTSGSLGNVGIGTTTLNARLSVYGDAIFAGTTGTPTVSAYIKGNSDNSTASTPDYTWYSDLTTGIFHPASSVISFSKGGSEAMRVHSNGNIGINTTSPSYTLDVTGNARITGALTSGATTVSSLTNSGTMSSGATTVTSFTNSGNTTLSGTLSSGATTVSSFTNTGNEVISGSLSSGATTVSSFTNTGSTILSGSVKNTTYTVGTSGKRVLLVDETGLFSALAAGTSSQVLYGNGAWGSLPAQTFTLSGSNAYFTGGKVGIGTSTPSYSLDVTGDIRATGTITGGATSVTSFTNSGNTTLSGSLSSGAATVSSLTSSGAISGGATTVTSFTSTGGVRAATVTSTGDITGGAATVSSLTSSGGISAATLTVTGNQTVSGSVTTNTLTASVVLNTPKLISNRITASDTNGVHIGDSSMVFQTPHAINPLTSSTVYYDKMTSSLGKVALGNSIALGGSSTALGSGASVGSLPASRAYNTGSMALGNGGTESDGYYSTAIGNNVKTGSSADYAIALGSGYSGHPMTNNTLQTLAVGFNSDVPTMFVTGGDGTSGSWGSVGIGTTSPAAPLDVNGLIKGGSSSNYVLMGYNTVNNVIESVGTSAGLLVNYTSGKDVALCTGSGGVVSTGNNVEIGGPTRNTNIALNMKTTGTYAMKIANSTADVFRVDATGQTVINTSSGYTGLWVSTPGLSSGTIANRFIIDADNVVGLSVINTNATSTSTSVFSVRGNGATYIGGFTPIGNHADALLSVYGKALFTSAYVNISSAVWSDYVFNKDYKLLPLKEVEAYYLKNKHLNGVPSAEEMQKNGDNIVETDAILLRKIEENTLYIVELNKKIEAQQKLIEELSKKVKQSNK